MSIRVFTQSEADILSIAGEQFPLRPLPSGKAVHFEDMLKDINLETIFDSVTNGISNEMSTSEEFQKMADNLFSLRYTLIAYGLQIKRDTPDYSKLTSAIDEAGFKEIFWAIDQIMDVNGFKYVEKMVKNLFETLKPMIPDLREIVSRSLKKYSEKEDLMEDLEKKLEVLRSTGTTSSSPDSQESPTSILQPIS